MTQPNIADASRDALTVAAAQFAAGDDMEKNLAAIEEMTTTAVTRGAGIVVFPEAAMYAWDTPREALASVAADHGDTFVHSLRDIAGAAGVTIVAGMFAISAGPLPVNRLVAVDASGVRSAYDKAHLYDAFDYQESERVAVGPTFTDHSELGIFRLGGWTVGLLNCYDLRFPEMARLLTEQGVDILAVSSAWVTGPHKEAHWETLLRARAIENTCYVVAASQPPPISTGLSMVVDPLGLVAATCTGSHGLAMHRLDPMHLSRIRELVPSVRQRRYTVLPRDPEPPDADHPATR